MAATDDGGVPPGRRAKRCTYCGYGDYVAQRSAAGTQNTVLHISQAWRLRSEAECRRDAELNVVHIAGMAATDDGGVPPGRRVKRCTYCGYGETADAQH